MFFDIDLRDAQYFGDILRLPAQALPEKKKNKEWVMDCMNTLETIGIRQLNSARRRFEDAYRIVEGSYRYSNVVNTSAFLSEVDMLRSQSDLSEDLQHYGFIEPIVNTMIGEFLTKPNPNVVYTDDPLSTNEYLRNQKTKLWEGVNNAISKEIEIKLLSQGFYNERQFKSEEEQQQYVETLRRERDKNIPQEVKKYMESEWKPIYLEWAEKTLEEGEVRFDMDELYRDLFRDYLITGRCFLHWRIGHDYYQPERWSPLNTFTSITQDEKYPEVGEYVGRIQYLTPNQVVANFGSHLTEVQKQDLLRSKHYRGKEFSTASIDNTQDWLENNGGTLRRVPFGDAIGYENLGVIQDQTGIDLGYRGMFPNQLRGQHFFFNDNDNRYDLIRVVEAYWVSYKRVGYLTYTKPDGTSRSEVVTDELLKDIINEFQIKKLRTVTLDQHTKNPQDNTIVWDYVPEVRYGVKILNENTDLPDHLYLFGGAIDYQLKGESATYHTLMPVTGLLEHTSLVSRVEIDQVEYSLAMNMARDYMSKELGLFFLMDLAYMPEFLKDFGGDEAIEKLMEVTRNLGFLPVDSSQARGTSFNNFQMVNMDLTAAMMGKLNFAQAIKMRAFEKLGFTPQRMAVPVEQETATGIRTSQTSSYAQTEVWFDKFSRFQQRTAEMQINIAQWLQHEGKDVTVNYTDSDLTRQFVSIIDPDLPLRRFKIYTRNNTKRRSELELLKEVYMRDNTISKNLEDMAEVVSADSTAKIIQLARLSRKQKDLMEQQQQQQQMQMMQMQQQGEMAKEEQKHKNKIELEKVKGEIALNKQAILALGFAKPSEEGTTDETPLVIEQLKASTQDLERKYKERVAASDLRQRQLDSDRRFMLDQQANQVKAQEAAARVEVANKQLQVAQTNKNRYDKK